MGLSADDVAGMFATRVAGGQVSVTSKGKVRPERPLVEVVMQCYECGADITFHRYVDAKPMKQTKWLCDTCAEF